MLRKAKPWIDGYMEKIFMQLSEINTLTSNLCNLEMIEKTYT